MPGHLHETIVKLLKDAPAVLEELIVETLHVPVPAHSSVGLGDADLSSVAPAKYQPDGVFVFKDGDRTVFAVALEVLNNPDDDKEWALPAYWASTRARLRCPTLVLVLATSASAASFARSLTTSGDPHPWRPWVIGPQEMPAVTSVEATRELPERAVLSALLHADDEQVLAAVVGGLLGLSPGTGSIEYYLDVILTRGGELARVIREKLMRPPGYEYQSDFARRYFGEGETKGRQEGRQEGETKGRQEGETKAARRILVSLLKQRRFSVTESQLDRIEQCNDVTILERWAERSVTAASPDDVFLDV